MQARGVEHGGHDDGWCDFNDLGHSLVWEVKIRFVQRKVIPCHITKVEPGLASKCQLKVLVLLLLLLIIATGFVADLDAVNVAEIAAEIGSDVVKSEFARRFLGGFTGYCVKVAV